MLVTERPGRMRIATPDGKLSPPLQGVPKVAASGQGGLLDVVLDRDFAQNKTIYFCFAEPASGGARTAMARATLGEGRLDDVKVIFRQDGPLSSGNHFGCRIAQSRRQQSVPDAWASTSPTATRRRSSTSHLGKIVRIKPDGSVPDDNPFVGRKDAKPEIWSYGHRNAQGAAIHPATGKLWEHEHGAARRRRGQHSAARQELRLAGDLLRRRTTTARRSAAASPRCRAWSSRSNTGCRRSRRPAWRSTRAICSRRGRAACSSARSPARCWCGSTLDGDKVTGEERLLQGLRERIRDVRVGPDGAIYLVTDNSAGRILKVDPAK